MNLKVSCIKPEICKVGFPINSLEKYTDLLIQKRYSYVIYYFDQEKEELQILEEYQRKKNNNLEEENMNCYICSKSTKQYKKSDKYLLALSKLYENEEQNNIKKYNKNHTKNRKKQKKNRKNNSIKEKIERERRYGFKTRTRK